MPSSPRRSSPPLPARLPAKSPGRQGPLRRAMALPAVGERGKAKRRSLRCRLPPLPTPSRRRIRGEPAGAGAPRGRRSSPPRRRCGATFWRSQPWPFRQRQRPRRGQRQVRCGVEEHRKGPCALRRRRRRRPVQPSPPCRTGMGGQSETGGSGGVAPNPAERVNYASEQCTGESYHFVTVLDLSKCRRLFESEAVATASDSHACASHGVTQPRCMWRSGRSMLCLIQPETVTDK